MVRISEIVDRTTNHDSIDSLIDDKVAKRVYKLYNEVLIETNNFTNPVKGLHNSVHSRLSYQLLTITDYVITMFPITSAARKMVEEMNSYFN